MITSQTLQQNLRLKITEPSRTHNTGLSQLFSAAVINQQFCQLLLENPESALLQGYLGNTFALTNEEKNLIISIRAISLADLATQVTKALKQ